MTKMRRGGYIFLKWAGDHPPRHVHVLRDGRLVLRWDLDLGRVMSGHASTGLVELIADLEREGRL